jgi:uncharacterized protein (TIGR02246 family)
MKSLSVVILVATLLLALSSCAPPATNVEEVRKTIEEKNAAFVSAYGAKDVAAIMNQYAPNATFLPQHGPAATTREEIEGFYNRSFEVFKNLNTTITSVDASGDLAYAIGSYTGVLELPGATAQPDTGKYLAVWKRQADGQWLIVADIFNTNLPAPTPPPAPAAAKR